MKKLLKFLRGYRLSTILAPLFKLTEAAFELVIPLVVANIIDVGIANGDTTHILKMGGVMLLLGALGLIFSLTCQYMAARASLGFGTNVRSALYQHINRLSQTEADNIGQGSLITRLNSDVVSVQNGVSMFIRLVLRTPFIAVGAIVMAFTINTASGIMFIVMAVVVSAILFLIMTRSARHYRKIQKGLDKVNTLSRENLSGVRVVRAFSNELEHTRDFGTASQQLNVSHKRVGAISGLLNPLTYAIINMCVILVLFIGGKSVNSGVMGNGQIIALVNYLSQILLALIVTANLAVTFTKAATSAGRISDVLDIVPTISSPDSPTQFDKTCPTVLSFNNVCFAYTGANNMLKNISFTLLRGQTLGIIGSTGSGKSTLVNLIPRFGDASSGSITTFGCNIKDVSLFQLRSVIGLVPQRASLFSGTLRDNLKLGNACATDDTLLAALKIAQGEDILKKLGGLDSVINQGGKNLSGGQKQRLTIARALVINPQLLILDDSSSALDYATDFKLRKAIRDANITTIIVSQRESSIRHANQILVLDDGAAAGLGTHDQLIASCKVYREIVGSQNDDAEVDNEKE